MAGHLISCIVLLSWLIFAGYGCKDLDPANGSSSGTEALKALEIASAAALESVSQDAGAAAAQAAFRDGTQQQAFFTGNDIATTAGYINHTNPDGDKETHIITAVKTSGNVEKFFTLQRNHTTGTLTTDTPSSITSKNGSDALPNVPDEFDTVFRESEFTTHFGRAVLQVKVDGTANFLIRGT